VITDTTRLPITTRPMYLTVTTTTPHYTITNRKSDIGNRSHSVSSARRSPSSSRRSSSIHPILRYTRELRRVNERNARLRRPRLRHMTRARNVSSFPIVFGFSPPVVSAFSVSPTPANFRAYQTAVAAVLFVGEFSTPMARPVVV